NERQFASEIGASFRSFGFALVGAHGLDPGLVAQAWGLTEALFALPEAEKRRYAIPGQAGARGYTPFGVEVAKGAEHHDLKEFWHVGREPRGPGMAANVWPDRPGGFRATFPQPFAQPDRIG